MIEYDSVQITDTFLMSVSQIRESRLKILEYLMTLSGCITVSQIHESRMKILEYLMTLSDCIDWSQPLLTGRCFCLDMEFMRRQILIMFDSNIFCHPFLFLCLNSLIWAELELYFYHQSLLLSFYVLVNRRNSVISESTLTHFQLIMILPQYRDVGLGPK